MDGERPLTTPVNDLVAAIHFPRRKHLFCVFRWNIEQQIDTHWSYTDPDFVFLDKLENLLVMKRILCADYEEFLFVTNQLLNIFPEQRKWWIGDDDIGLLEQLDAFLAAKIAVTL